MKDRPIGRERRTARARCGTMSRTLRRTLRRPLSRGSSLSAGAHRPRTFASKPRKTFFPPLHKKGGFFVLYWNVITVRSKSGKRKQTTEGVSAMGKRTHRDAGEEPSRDIGEERRLRRVSRGGSAAPRPAGRLAGRPESKQKSPRTEHVRGLDFVSLSALSSHEGGGPVRLGFCRRAGGDYAILFRRRVYSLFLCATLFL